MFIKKDKIDFLEEKIEKLNQILIKLICEKLSDPI